MGGCEKLRQEWGTGAEVAWIKCLVMEAFYGITRHILSRKY